MSCSLIQSFIQLKDEQIDDKRKNQASNQPDNSFNSSFGKNPNGSLKANIHSRIQKRPQSQNQNEKKADEKKKLLIEIQAANLLFDNFSSLYQILFTQQPQQSQLIGSQKQLTASQIIKNLTKEFEEVYQIPTTSKVFNKNKIVAANPFKNIDDKTIKKTENKAINNLDEDITPNINKNINNKKFQIRHVKLPSLNDRNFPYQTSRIDKTINTNSTDTCIENQQKMQPYSQIITSNDQNGNRQYKESQLDHLFSLTNTQRQIFEKINDQRIYNNTNNPYIYNNQDQQFKPCDNENVAKTQLNQTKDLHQGKQPPQSIFQVNKFADDRLQNPYSNNNNSLKGESQLRKTAVWQILQNNNSIINNSICNNPAEPDKDKNDQKKKKIILKKAKQIQKFNNLQAIYKKQNSKSLFENRRQPLPLNESNIFQNNLQQMLQQNRNNSNVENNNFQTTQVHPAQQIQKILKGIKDGENNNQQKQHQIIIKVNKKRDHSLQNIQKNNNIGERCESQPPNLNRL